MRPARNVVARVLLGAAIGVITAGVTASAAYAETGTWQTDAAVGTSEVTYTLSLACTGQAGVCALINGYVDVQTSTVTGGGSLEVDEVGDTVQFLEDSTQDLLDGAGAIPAYATLDGTNMAFAVVPLFGAPEVANPVVFSIDSPLVGAPNLDLLVPATIPISTTMTLGALADMIGDLSLIVPNITVTPTPVTVTGTLEILGDTDMNGQVEYEIRDLTASASSVEQYVEGTIVIDVFVTADMVVNLSGEVAAPALPVPALGHTGIALLVLALIALGVFMQLTTSRGPREVRVRRQ